MEEYSSSVFAELNLFFNELFLLLHDGEGGGWVLFCLHYSCHWYQQHN
jgi:hypothetical protein